MYRLVLYVTHGSKFIQTKLFLHLLKGRQDKPLVVVLDELPESEMAEIWNHLKPRCGFLKIVSLDHALFSRFGFEAPVGAEAKYIAQMIQKADPTIGV